MTRGLDKHRHRGAPRVAGTLVLTLLLAGCAGADRGVASRESKQLPMLAVEQALAAVGERDSRVHSMRARFNAAVQLPTEERRASGVVIVKKPDRLRLRLLSPFGLTVMDYTLTSGTARLHLPLDGKVLVGDAIENSTSFSPTAFAPAFLATHSPSLATCTVNSNEGFADCWESAAPPRALRVGLRQPVVQRETLYAGTEETLSLEFTDYRSVDGLLMPFRIDATSRGAGLRLRIDIVAYELNPVLADSLFEPSNGAR